MITMNERITELFKLAGGKTSIHNLMSNPMQQREYSELWNENIQKFAELIVQECVSIVNKRKDAAIDDNWLVDEAMSHAVWDIEEHFGVKECGTKN